MPIRLIPRPAVAGLTWDDIKEKLRTEGAINKQYDPDVDGYINRTTLEYPTEDVSFVYLQAIDKLRPAVEQPNAWQTLDIFTDKALEVVQGWIRGVDTGALMVRGRDRTPEESSYYALSTQPAASTADFSLWKRVAGTVTRLGDEAVDISDWAHYDTKISCSGSSIKAFREDMTTPKISVTDTDIPDGRFGIGFINRSYQYDYKDHHYHFVDYIYAYLRPPSSISPKVQAIIEYDVIGMGSVGSPIQPDMPKNITESGINTLAVSWGAIDFKVNDNTYVCAIYNSRIDNVLKHIGIQRSKGRFTTTVKYDVMWIREIYNKIRKLKAETLITPNELLYQILGEEKYEVLAIADFYEREVLDLGRVKPSKIVDFDRVIERWMDKARRYKLYDAVEKFNRVRKRG